MRRTLIAVVIVVTAPLWLPYTCPVQHLFLCATARALIDAKNRTANPAPSDFDSRVTLTAMLAPGRDENRWSDQRAATIAGYVVRVESAGLELANCLSLFNRDTHIEVAERRDAPPTARVIVEMTPVIRDQAKGAGRDWSVKVLKTLLGKRVEFQGWLLFDREHATQAENWQPGAVGNWRATAWELHPVTAFHVLN